MLDLNEILGEEFWQYSHTLYAEKPVEKACLYLQNNFKADVNILLFLCWLTQKGYDFCNKKNIKAMIEISLPWQRDVVEPMRQLRKQIGAMKGEEAKNVKASLLLSELEAEKSEQYYLANLAVHYAQTRIKKSEKKKIVKNAFLLYMQALSSGQDKPKGNVYNPKFDVLLKHAFEK